jgi:cytochrome c-type biogenesis protein CcmE
MKRSHIFAIVLIAAAVAVILSTLSDSSTYATFSVADESPDRTYHVVGKLDREKPQVYDPVSNANLFTFYMIDNEGKERQVLLNQAKPQDFDKSEQIVVVGKSQGGQFVASQILMKCPSKYNNPKDQNPQNMMKQG